jgi:hypothetical protein
MIKLKDTIAPTPATLVQLANWQAEIAGTYDEQIALAKTHFKNKNHNKNATFNDVKKETIFLMLQAILFRHEFHEFFTNFKQLLRENS